ncbi:hypothetical protein SAMN05421747_10412 [Parapedobacter composti]|uniref:Uncharacterized protein n=1 Tax=Parapedobacter composti TaxID=623281 RepID=A0A1I1G713_9SPHI|nr:hypothetical protein [Parapedobacter composti]SFC07364.1 hypothetical protein SAMN05421747_10412 [Parapedobacter composti]
MGSGVDPWAKALSILKKLKPGQWLKVRDVAKHNPEFFKEIVKQLIRAGWSEYEFNGEYTEIRRLDLPDYARAYYRVEGDTNDVINKARFENNKKVQNGERA